MEIIKKTDLEKQNFDDLNNMNYVTQRSNGNPSETVRKKEIKKESIKEKSKYLKYLITVDKCLEDDKNSPKDTLTPKLVSSKSFLSEHDLNSKGVKTQINHSKSLKGILKLNLSGLSELSGKAEKKKVNFNVEKVFLNSPQSINQKSSDKQMFQKSKDMKFLNIKNIKPYNKKNSKNRQNKSIPNLLNFFPYTENSEASRVYHDEKSGLVCGFSVYNFTNLNENEGNKNCNTTKIAIDLKNQNNYFEENPTENSFSLFSIYEGHNGDSTSNLLKNRIVQQLIFEKKCLTETIKCILKVFDDCEEIALIKNLTNNDLSGSSALVCIIKSN
jgi:hypothetical protein